MSERFQIAAEVEGRPQVETLMGREYSVFPAVLVRSQILNNNLGRTFLPAAEIEASVDAWNGIPAVIRHPKKNGKPTSARTPEVLNATGVGFLYRARFEDEALKADVFVDLSRSGEVDDAEGVVSNVENGSVGEVSTGFGTNVERVDHEDYDMVMRDLVPDHLALLVDETGACSIQDGCGLGTNAEDDPKWTERAKAWFRRVVLGRSDADLHEQLRAALSDTFGGGRWVWVADVFQDDDLVVYEIGGMDDSAELFRVTFGLEEGGTVTFGTPELVRRVTTYEPVANAGHPSEEEEATMKRAEMIAHLAEAGPLDQEALEALNDCQLGALVGVNAEGDQEPPDDGPTVAELAEKLDAMTAELAEVKDAASIAAEEIERERVELVRALAGNERVAFDEPELEAMGLNVLRKLAQTARVRNYGGRGGPRADTNNADESDAPVRPYWSEGS